MKTAPIQIADGVALPVDTIVQRKLIVAKNRVGKSNTACAYVEETMDLGIQVVIIDPKGDWYGLRSSGDGEGPGYPVLVMGGDHGDVSLEAGAGEMLGRYFGQNRVSVVLDVSDFTKKNMLRFCADFLEAMYDAKKKHRDGVLLLVIEEADEIAPQKLPSYGGEVQLHAGRCLAQAERMAKRAGFLGIGMLCVTQRWASLNKDITTQTDVMIVMRITAPQDKKAGDAWFKEQDEDLRKEVQKNLASLRVGEGYVWAPELGIFQRAKFRRRRTYDSGYTPKVGEKRQEPKVLARVELEALKGEMAQFVEKAKENDPEELKKQVRELKAQVRKLGSAAPAEPEVRVEVERVEVPVVDVGHLEVLARLRPQLREVAGVLTDMDGILATQEMALRAKKDQEPRVTRTFTSTPQPRPRATNGTRPRAAPPANPVRLEGVTPAQQRILNGLAWLEIIGVPLADKTQLALLADASPTSSSYANNLGALRTAGFIEYPLQGKVQLTDAGRKGADAGAAPTTPAEIHDMIQTKVTPAKWRLLEVLIKAYPEHVAKDALAEKAGASPTSSSFANNLGSLRSLGLLDYPAPGFAVAAPVLFLEGTT